jgi:polar amino acid transport system permease protein
MSYQLQFGVLGPFVPLFVRATGATLGITMLAMALATLVGIALALSRLSRWRWASRASRAVMEIIRGIPALVLVIYVYYGVSAAIGVNIGPLEAAVTALGLYYGAYLSETFRAGILAVDVGEIEAGAAIGMTPIMVLRRVVLPQTFRIILPPYANYAIGMLKDSSLVSVIGVLELTRQGELVETATFRPFEVYTVVAGIYLLFSSALSWTGGRIEARLRRGEA